MLHAHDVVPGRLRAVLATTIGWGEVTVGLLEYLAAHGHTRRHPDGRHQITSN